MLHNNVVRLTEFLLSRGSIDVSKRPILVYGCELALSTLTSFASIAVISIFIQDFISSLLFIAIFFFLRLFSGGFHASTYTRCFIITAFLETEGADTANTNNEVININAGHPMVTQETGRQNRYQAVCGLFAHELGHVLYTDFLAPQTQLNFLGRGLWYPEPPALRTSPEYANEKALWAYLKADEKNREAVQTVAHTILNVLEDGYIENRMLLHFPGTLGFALETVRAGQQNEMPTVTQMKVAEEDGRFHILDSILQIMLGYVKFGEIKYGDESLSDERIQTSMILLRLSF